MTPAQYRREGAEAMRLDILDLLITAAVTGDHPDDPLTAIIRAIDVDEVLAKLDIVPAVVERLVGKLSFPSDWRDRCGGMNMKQQGIWSDGFRTCREQAEAKLVEVTAELEQMTAIKNIHQNKRAEYFDRAEKAEAENERLRDAMQILHDDMLERAQCGMDVIHGEEYRVVNAGNSAWSGFVTALQRKERNE